MKKITHYIFFLICVSLSTACSIKEEMQPVVANDVELMINIKSSINQEHTKATAAGFVDGDAVGLYAVNYINENATPGTLSESGNQADNVKYIFDEANHKWTPVRSVYYKDVNTNVDIFLYYPYQADIKDVDDANFEVKKDQSAEGTATSLSGYEASDFLWGKGENITPVESAVSISLNHKLSAVQVTLVDNGGFEEGEFAGLEKNVIVTNTTRKAKINYTNGVVTKLGDPQLDGIVMCPQDDGSFRAVVIPQTVAAGERLFSITIGGVTYGFKQSSAATEYRVGKQTNFTINVTKKTPAGEYEFSLGDVQISDWTEDKNTHGGEARQYYVVNLTEAGTLEATITAAGKNPAKIKNLKVTGPVTTSDFYFMRDKMTILEAVNMKEANVVNAQTTSSKTSYLADDVIPFESFSNKKSLCYFTFPENISYISEKSFNSSGLSGSLVLPDNVTEIGDEAFKSTRISSVIFPQFLSKISSCSFSGCSYLSGELMLNSSLQSIGNYAFSECNLSGKLNLPESLSYIGRGAFQNAGRFVGDLKIPDNITNLYGSTFWDCGFTGSLDLNNVTIVGSCEFYSCTFSGELIIPDGMTAIPELFCGSHMPSRPGRLTSIILPVSIKEIESGAFKCQTSLSSIVFNDGLIAIGSESFSLCYSLISIDFPSSLQSIGNNAFYSGYYLSSIKCDAIEPPTIQSGAFDGVAKDNFTVEVPAQSVKRYQSESGWQDFKRIAAHYDFSVSRERMRALNAALERTYTLRAPAGFDWAVTDVPDWVTVTPTSGTGKTDITVSVSEMARTSETFEVNEGTYNSPQYKNYKGRAGEIVFTLTDKDYTCSMDIEQYDSDHSDGDVTTYNTATAGPGIDIVFIGEGYDAKDIAKGTFLSNAEAGYGHLFDLEPYKTYKDYFNVKAVVSMSDESGIGTVNTIIDTKFGSYFTQNRILTPEAEPCFAWAKKANPSMDLTKSLTIMLMNTSTYEGVCMMYGDGSAIACCPVSTESYPYDFRGIIQHEAGGHGFGKLGDEYIYHNAFIQNCICSCCNHPQSDTDINTTFGRMKSLGWYKNLSMEADMKRVPWAHLIYHKDYSDYVDMYEGGYMHTRGMYRSEATSCMNNNIPYYSAISRQAIVERIKYCAGQTFSLEDFYANDDDSFGTITKSSVVVDRTFGVDPKFNRGSEQGSVVFMGEHPDFSKIK